VLASLENMAAFPNKAKIIYLYHELLEEFNKGPCAVGWFDGRAQQKGRFSSLLYLLNYLPPRKKLRLLDLGCGLGDFYGYLKKQGSLSRYKIKYTGYDFSPDMIKKCKQRYPRVKFQEKDILGKGKVPKYDVIMASGIFNLKLADRRKDHLKWVSKILNKMHDLSRFGIAVDFQSKADKVERDRLEYAYDAKEIIGICERIAPRFVLHHSLNSFDYCVYLLK
jgi:SAM-dependent methyltransferase